MNRKHSEVKGRVPPPDVNVQDLVQQLAELDAALQAVTSGQVDAVLDPKTASPILLRGAQAALQESEARYRTLFETMAQGVVYIDAQECITAANPAAERILGLSLAEMRGQIGRDLHWRTIYPDGSDFPVDAYPAMVALRTGQAVDDVVAGVFNSRDQAFRWLRIRAVPQFRPGETQPYQVYTIFEDITAPRLAEAEKTKALGELRERVKELTALHQVARLLQDRERPTNEILQEVAQILPAAFFSPEATAIRIRVNGAEFLSHNFAETPWKLSSAFAISDATQGVIEAYVTDDRWASEGEPFLLEEHYVLQSVAEILGTDLQRRYTERALRESEARYRTFYDSAPVIICELRTDGVLAALNPAFTDIIGWSREEWLDKPFWLLVHPDDVSPTVDTFRAILQGGKSRPIEVRVRSKEGAYRLLEVSGYQHFQQGQVIGVIGYAHDITERRQVEEQIQFQAHLLQTVGQAVIATDLAGAILYWNRAAEKLYGWSAAEVIGRSVYEITVSQTSRQQGEEIMAALQAGESWSGESIVQDRSGRVFPALVTNAPIHDKDETLIGIIGVSTDISERKQRERELAAIAAISSALRAAQTRSEILSVVLDESMKLLDADSASLCMWDQATGKILIERTVGEFARAEGARLSPEEGVSGHVISTGQPYVTADVKEDPHFFAAHLIEGVHAVGATPLIAHGQTIGALVLGRTHPFADLEMRLLTAIADIVATAIHRATLYDQTQQSNTELALAYDTTLAGWSRALELRDRDTEGHTWRVTRMTERLARAMGMDDAEIVHIRRGALLHDIGKMGIPDEILRKPGPLTEAEWETMRKHPVYAYEMLSSIAYLRPALDIPYCHHEKWDGSGYPQGLAGEQIPLAARIFAVVDVWDALRSDRPYRPAWTGEQALAYIQEQAGKHFDPRVVEVFLRTIVHGPEALAD